MFVCVGGWMGGGVEGRVGVLDVCVEYYEFTKPCFCKLRENNKNLLDIRASNRKKQHSAVATITGPHFFNRTVTNTTVVFACVCVCVFVCLCMCLPANI
jgi:hypothetical protein